jgi:hypothetical protein
MRALKRFILLLLAVGILLPSVDAKPKHNNKKVSYKYKAPKYKYKKPKIKGQRKVHHH